MSKLRQRLMKKAELSVSYEQFEEAARLCLVEDIKEDTKLNKINKTLNVNLVMSYLRTTIEEDLGKPLTDEEWNILVSEYIKDATYSDLDTFEKFHGDGGYFSAIRDFVVESSYDFTLCKGLGIDIDDLEKEGKAIEVIEVNSSAKNDNSTIYITLDLVVGIVEE